MFFTAPALLLRFTFFCVGIYIGNLPEARYFLLAFYRYFRVNSDSVRFLRPCWQPCISFPCMECNTDGDRDVKHEEWPIYSFGPWVTMISARDASASKNCHKLSKVFPVSKKCSLIMQQILPTPDSAFLQQFNYDFRFWTPLYFTPGIIIFDVLVPRVFRKYTTCMVFNWLPIYYCSLNILTVQMKVVQIGVFSLCI